jgi:hypothetical protein
MKLRDVSRPIRTALKMMSPTMKGSNQRASTMRAANACTPAFGGGATAFLRAIVSP